MRIITWNCCGGFLGKAKHIAKLEPDILSVQEVEAIDDIRLFSEESRPTYTHRVSLNPRAKKSIGMFSYTGTKLSFIESMRGIRKYEVQYAGEVFHGMAVWTSATAPPHKGYRQLHDALEQSEVVKWISQRPTVVLGDFNQSAKFASDGWSKLKKLTDSLGFVSAYHHFRKENFGQESLPTHYHHHKKEKPFHLDYCFIPKQWAPRITNVQVGAYEDWRVISDHVPLIVDIDL